ncbi:MAG: flagellar protein FlaG [Spirochaetaceae bacterium]|jgi:flagellar protein FlaG|nr:flagellar protein FlaG [Spirochaetaceae bacterium]
MNTMTNIAETGYLRPFIPDGRRGRGSENASPIFGGSDRDAEASFLGAGESGKDKTDLKSEIANLERISLAFNKELRFVIDYKSSEITVNVIDPDTDKVIKVLPPEELRRLHNKIEDAIGFLFDEKV